MYVNTRSLVDYQHQFPKRIAKKSKNLMGIVYHWARLSTPKSSSKNE